VQGVRLRMNWASKPKSVAGEDGLLGDFTPRVVALPAPGTGAGAPAGAAGGGSAGAGGGGSAGAGELYPGQALGLPPPPGFAMAVRGPAGSGPLKTDTRAARPPPPFYPSQNPLAMGARLV
jgi:hypothetical protein